MRPGTQVMAPLAGNPTLWGLLFKGASNYSIFVTPAQAGIECSDIVGFQSALE